MKLLVKVIIIFWFGFIIKPLNIVNLKYLLILIFLEIYCDYLSRAISNKCVEAEKVAFIAYYWSIQISYLLFAASQ